MKTIKQFSIVWLILFLLLPAAFAQTKKPIVASDVMKIVTTDQLQISPDGTRAICVVTRKAKKGEDEYYYTRHLYTLDLVGNQQPVQLTYGDKNDSQPTWSPDGKHIAFVRRDGDKAQIWILPMMGGEAYPLTKSKYGASGPRWSPNGTKILFSASIGMTQIEGNVPWSYERPGRTFKDEPDWKNLKDEEKKNIKASPDGSTEEIRAWLAKNANEKNPRVINKLQFQAEQDLQTDQQFGHLFVVDFKQGAEAIQITKGFQSFGGATWSPDGNFIICSSTRYTESPDYNRHSSIWTMRSDGSELKEIINIPDQPAFGPSYSPDGKSILFGVQTGAGFLARQSDLATANANGSSVQVLTKDFDRDAGNALWSGDGKSVYFVAQTEGDAPLFVVSAKGGNATKITGEDSGVNDYDIKNDRIVYALTEFKNPWEVYVHSTKDKSNRQITAFNDWVNEKNVLLPKEHWVTRPDGMKVQYWVIEPANRKEGSKYPTILNIHGGPTAMWGPAGFSMWHEFEMQVNWGYGLVFCNPRGSGGYGDAFKKGNFKDWGTGPANDILAALDDAAKKYSWIDTNQYFTTGGSYAGYMVAWLVSQDQRFKAANCQRGVYELSTFMGEGNAWRLVPDYFGGYPWDDESKKILDANSPMTFVDQIKTPLLIMHSDQDLRTGVIQSEMLYKSLKILSRPVEYVRYPGEGHELSRSGNPRRMMDRLVRIVEFFDRYATHPEPRVTGSN
ncbi:MAG: prolyl oligopeptidase family serine peptidase [Flammeovirgaceae bacterium]|nr:prolyl oligopeptidase family serine peptidase [Flammeovirgaceae bacterium]